MADTEVVLGGVVFDGYAIPDKINFGGAHPVKVHKMIGGARVVNPLGADPDPITWSAKFRGPDSLGIAAWNMRTVMPMSSVRRLGRASTSVNSTCTPSGVEHLANRRTNALQPLPIWQRRIFSTDREK